MKKIFLILSAIVLLVLPSTAYIKGGIREVDPIFIGSAEAFVLKAGSTMTGILTMSADIVATANTIEALTLTDGTTSFTAGAGSGLTTLSMNNQLTNTLADGTAPFVVTSTTTVENLNVDQVDGKDSTDLVLVDGSQELIANWDAGSHWITSEGFESDVTTGTPPLVVASITKVDNLNADYLDGHNSTYFLTQEAADDLYVIKAGDTMTGTLTLETLNATGIATIEFADINTVSAESVTAEVFESTIATGTAPFIVASDTLVTNLNADLLDGHDWSEVPSSGDYVLKAGDTMTGTLTISASSGRGVSATTSNSSGLGVFGNASATGAVTNYGGYFQSAGDTGRGIHGYATGSSGYGVYGYATATGAYTNYGGYFRSAGDTGRGVYGSATGASGYGVYGEATGSGGYAGYFTGGKGVKVTGTIESTLASGAAPFIVASDTLVTNLNADLLDGQEGSYYAPATGGDYVAKAGDTMTGALTVEADMHLTVDAAEKFTIDAYTADHTDTSGVIDIDVDAVADGVNGITSTVNGVGNTAFYGTKTQATSGGLTSAAKMIVGGLVEITDNAADTAGVIIGQAIVSPGNAGGAATVYGTSIIFSGAYGPMTSELNGTGLKAGFNTILVDSGGTGNTKGSYIEVENKTNPAGLLFGQEIKIKPNVGGISTAYGLNINNAGSQGADAGIWLGGASSWLTGIDLSDANIITAGIDMGSSGILTTGSIGRDVDNQLNWGTDNQLDIVIDAKTTSITSISKGTGDNDRLVTQGYVDDGIDAEGALRATVALDNLDSVNINSSLAPNSPTTFDLGSEPRNWKKLFLVSEIGFEGATDDDYQTTFSVTDPTTVDKIITFQDADGIVAMDDKAVTDLEGTKLSITAGTLNVTETDSVVGAITGIVQADGGGNISAAVADTDYQQAVTWGDGLEYSAGTAKIDHNTTNLKITATEIDTIQGISTAATPTFAGMNVSTGGYYKYNGANFAMADTALGNYFTGRAGNLTMTGESNTAIGYQALLANTSGYENTANGHFALRWNTAGDTNTAIGKDALYTNTIGEGNTAIGSGALFSNTFGITNVGIGKNALRSNTTGMSNTVMGKDAMQMNTTGNNNTGIGYDALWSNTTGISNAALGYATLIFSTTGEGNTALGYFAGYGDGSTANERSIIDTYSTFIGYQASRNANISNATTLTNATAIGYKAKVGASNSLVLGGTGDYAVNVGIGTPEPQAELHVVGDLKVTGTIESESPVKMIGGLQLQTGGLYVQNGSTGSINANAILQLDSTTEGFLPPRMTSTQRDAISVPTAGMVVYDSTNDGLNFYTTQWKKVVNTPAGSFTAGSIPFATGSCCLEDDNDNLFWDNTDKRMGIGTSEPVAELDVRGTIEATTLKSILLVISPEATCPILSGTLEGSVWYNDAIDKLMVFTTTWEALN